MFIFDVNWEAATAGPSPNNNERIEVFLLGCNKATSGNPCQGCFNPDTWHIPDHATNINVENVVANLLKHSKSRYLTFGGGEPLDQINELLEVAKILKKKFNFSIYCYTWRSIETILKGESDIDKDLFLELSKYVELFIEGPFEIDKRCYKARYADGLLGSVGSTNQFYTIPCNPLKLFKRYKVDAIKSIYATEEDLCIILKEGEQYVISPFYHDL